MLQDTRNAYFQCTRIYRKKKKKKFHSIHTHGHIGPTPGPKGIHKRQRQA